MAVVQFAGLDPGPHHVANVVLHSANTVLLLFCLYTLTGALGRSALVAAVFAIHPMHVETVAWIAQRKELLATLFCFLALLAWIQWTRSKKRRLYWAAVGLFVLGLMSKPTIANFPILLLLLDYWPLQRIGSIGEARAKILEKIPFLVLSVAIGIVTYFARTAVIDIQPLVEAPLGTRLMSVPDNYLFYLSRFFWPFQLAPHYHFSGQVSLAGFAAGLAIAGAITVLILWKARRHRYLVVGWFWFLLTILPMAGFVYEGNSNRSDTFTYVAQIGLVLLIVWGLYEVLGSYRNHAAVRVFAVLIVVALTARALNQTAYWRDSYTLFRHTLEVTGQNPVANLQVAEALRSARRYKESVDYVQKALQQNPKYVMALLTDARLKMTLKQPDEALVALDRAVKISPDAATVHFTRGLVLEDLRKEDECRASFQKALDLRLDRGRRSRALFGIGRSLMRVKRETEAIDYFRRSLELDPYNYLSRKNLGFALVAAQNYVEAQRQFQTLAAFNRDRRDQDVDQALRYLSTRVKTQ
jgi:tetratricopeptide (TPR) repeat protein